MKLISSNKFFKIFSSKEKRTKIIIALGIIGMLCIFLSEVLPTKSKDTTKTTASDSTTDETSDYKKKVEQELVDMLSQIKGVGEVSAMVTIEGTTEYIYAEELNTANDKNGDQTSEKYNNKIVITEENGEKKALVKQVIQPKISGVVIVCEGGGNISLNERVLKAVSTALNLPTSRICVEVRK